MKFSFLAFFEAKITKFFILDQKLIVPNDYQQLLVPQPSNAKKLGQIGP